MKKILLVFLSGLILIGLTSSALEAQSYTTLFPYVVNNSNTSTNLLFTNTSGRDVSVTLTGYPVSGSPIVIETPFDIPANAQLVVGPSTFPSFSGWVLAQGNADGVLGNLQVSSPNGSATEITSPAIPDTSFVLPFVAQASGGSTEISVVNPTVYVVRVGLTAYDNGGNEIATVQKQLSSYGLIQGTLTSVFGSDKNFDNVSHILVQALPANILSPVVKVIGFALVKDFAQLAGDEKVLGRTDWAALTGVPQSNYGSALTFPHIVRGFGWFSLVGIVNLSNQTQTVTFSYSPDSGSAPPPKGISIPANGSVRLTAVDLFGSPSGLGDSGPLKISGGSQLAGFLGIGLSSGSSFATAPGQAAGQTQFLFPAVNELFPSATGFVIYNDTSGVVTTDLYLISPSGKTLGRTERKIDPQARLIGSARSLFEQGLNLTNAYIYVTASDKVFGMSYVGVPAQAISQPSPQLALSSFAAPSEVLFGIRGKVTDYTSSGAPVSGVTLTLSKPGSQGTQTTSDNLGDYLFSSLVPADYVVTPSQTGYMFAPKSPLVTVDVDNKHQDFVRAPVPTVESVTVVTTDDNQQSTAGNNPDPFVVFGTSAVSLKFSGSNFAQGQTVVVVDPKSQSIIRQVETFNVNAVDSHTLFAKLVLSDPNDVTNLLPPGQYEIAVAGQGQFSENLSNLTKFYVLHAVPVLLSVTAESTRTAQVNARYEINSPGETITATGYGFLPSARILFNGGSGICDIQIDTKYINSTTLEAFIPAQALRFGGFYILRVQNVSDLPEISGEAVNFQVNNLKPEIYSLDPPGPLSIIGPGPSPVITDIKVNGSNFHPSGCNDPGTIAAFTLKIPDVFPAVVPVDGTDQCIPVNGQKVIRVRVFNTFGGPAAGVAVTFTAPSIATTGPTGTFYPGVSSVTVVTDGLGFASALTDPTSTLFTANPFGGSYPILITATVGIYNLNAAITMTNLKPGETCTATNSTVEYVSSGQIILKQVAITSQGTYGVVVANASPGGGYSQELELVVTGGPTGGVPQMADTNPLSPASRPAGSSDFVLTVHGKNDSFQSNAWINFGTVRLATRYVDANTLTATVPGLLISSPGTVPVTVTNPGAADNTGGTSGRALFSVTSP